jgi:nascent polypeptide-associated complex subunit alpha
MFPGSGRGMNPHKMKRMMKQMGINVEEITDVEEIVIKTPSKKYVFDSDTSVTIMVAQGQKTFQIIGDPQILDRIGGDAEDDSAEEESGAVAIPQADVDLVVAQTGTSEEEARAALEACAGNPAEAILKLLEN